MHVLFSIAHILNTLINIIYRLVNQFTKNIIYCITPVSKRITASPWSYPAMSMKILKNCLGF